METKAINTLKFLSLDMIDTAKSGHPGMPLGCAALMFVLWTKIIKYNPSDPLDINRDRFILSNGHGCALLYSMLYLLGFDYTLSDLKQFRKLHSKTPGHPEFNPKLGIECTTGPLGQGISNGVGMAIASKKMKIDNFIYIMCGDGCLMEGISYEACSLAGHLKLDNLIILYDDNNITIDGKTDITFTEKIDERFLSMNWDVFNVENGSIDSEDIFNKITYAKKSNKPSIIIVKTKIGYGSPLEDTSKAHGAPFGIDVTKKMKQNSLFDYESQFVVDKDVKIFFDEIKQKKQLAFKSSKIEVFNKLNTEIKFENTKNLCSTRELSGKVLEEIVLNNDRIIVGSADLSESNKIPFSKSHITFNDFTKSYIHYGVREHSMVGIANGLSTYGYVPIVGTFLIFINYCLASIRLSALSKHKVIYVLTHDSVFLGEDGPTHQPIESLTILRSIPDLITIRPCNNNEVKEAYRFSLCNNGPTAIILSRHNFDLYEKKNSDISKGAYIIHQEIEKLKYIIVATGSEVPLAINVANKLKNVRVVSMFSCEIYEKQELNYKNNILPSNIKKISLEAGRDIGWFKYVNYCYGINSFGESGHISELILKFQFTDEKIIDFINSLD